MGRFIPHFINGIMMSNATGRVYIQKETDGNQHEKGKIKRGRFNNGLVCCVFILRHDKFTADLFQYCFRGISLVIEVHIHSITIFPRQYRFSDHILEKGHYQELNTKFSHFYFSIRINHRNKLLFIYEDRNLESNKRLSLNCKREVREKKMKKSNICAFPGWQD